ncbi:MBL fold metallo-hydrolase [Kutzneria kofuensis]|uniref:MBL fold metallo-hydrolase n=1 Tax=Kutzneria kofuensis TaxID=103725 RepID=UPI0031EF7EEF
MSARWIEVADGVHVRRHEELDLSLGLVVGDDACLVVDTGGDEAQGAEWAAAVRAVTPLPWTVVLTHAHFDHAFGTQAFLPCPVLAHPNCVDELVVEGAEDKDKWAAHYDAQNQPEIAANIRAHPDRAAEHVGVRTNVVEPGVRHDGLVLRDPLDLPQVARRRAVPASCPCSTPVSSRGPRNWSTAWAKVSGESSMRQRFCRVSSSRRPARRRAPGRPPLARSARGNWSPVGRR